MRPLRLRHTISQHRIQPRPLHRHRMHQPIQTHHRHRPHHRQQRHRTTKPQRTQHLTRRHHRIIPKHLHPRRETIQIMTLMPVIHDAHHNTRFPLRTNRTIKRARQTTRHEHSRKTQRMRHKILTQQHRSPIRQQHQRLRQQHRTHTRHERKRPLSRRMRRRTRRISHIQRPHIPPILHERSPRRVHETLHHIQAPRIHRAPIQRLHQKRRIPLHMKRHRHQLAQIIPRPAPTTLLERHHRLTRRERLRHIQRRQQRFDRVLHPPRHHDTQPPTTVSGKNPSKCAANHASRRANSAITCNRARNTTPGSATPTTPRSATHPYSTSRGNGKPCNRDANTNSSTKTPTSGDTRRNRSNITRAVSATNTFNPERSPSPTASHARTCTNHEPDT
jgi:hypothetical protein